MRPGISEREFIAFSADWAATETLLEEEESLVHLAPAVLRGDAEMQHVPSLADRQFQRFREQEMHRMMALRRVFLRHVERVERLVVDRDQHDAPDHHGPVERREQAESLRQQLM